MWGRPQKAFEAPGNFHGAGRPTRLFDSHPHLPQTPWGQPICKLPSCHIVVFVGLEATAAQQQM
jgi:hypothetical protein